MAAVRSDDGTPGVRDTPSAANTAHTAARATALTIGFVLLSRVLGVLRDILLADIFGQDKHTTLYRAAFGVPDLIALVIAGGGLSSVFVPVFAQYWNEGKDVDAWRIFGTVMNVVMCVIAALVVGMEICVQPLTHLLNLKFAPDEVLFTASLSRVLLPAQWFLIVGGFMMGTLYARKQFFIPALGPVIYNLGTIVGLCTQFGSPHPDMTALTWGTMIGAAGGSFVLPLFALIRTKARWQPEFDLKHPGVQRVFRLMLPVIVGLSLGQLIMWVTQRCLPDDYRISALVYANNLTQAPIGIFAQAFAIVLLPTISNFAAEGRWQNFRLTVSQGIRRVLFLTLPASLLMSALALPLVRVIYEHGKFNDADAHIAATALVYYSLGTFAWSGLAILARGFYARQDNWVPVLITTPMIGVFFILAQIYLHFQPGGFVGLALSASIVGAVTMLLFLYFLQKRVGDLYMPAIIRSIIRTLIGAGIGAIAAGFTARWLERYLGAGLTGSAVTVVFAGSIGIGLFVGISFLFRSPELRSIGEMFRRKPKAA